MTRDEYERRVATIKARRPCLFAGPHIGHDVAPGMRRDQTMNDQTEAEEVHARVGAWAIVELREPNRHPTRHVVGYIISHARMADQRGDPYVGSSLIELNVPERTARNRRGRLVRLVGDPLPPGPLPRDIRAVLRRAEDEWALDDDTEWERVE